MQMRKLSAFESLNFNMQYNSVTYTVNWWQNLSITSTNVASNANYPLSDAIIKLAEFIHVYKNLYKQIKIKKEWNIFPIQHS